MDWLGGISSIKGQITNFTKDLLTESTSEIKDPVSELEITQARVVELESLVKSQKAEINSLRSDNEDLRVQLESAQFRLDIYKENFQKSLDEKEATISKLSSQISSARGEPEGESELVSSASVSTGASVKTKSKPLYIDLVSESASSRLDASREDGTATWEELQDEVIQLRTEVTKWKSIAKKKQSTDKNHNLNKEIERLKQELQDSEENRRSEIAAIQENHSDHIYNLMEQLKETERELISVRICLDKYSQSEKNFIDQSTNTESTPSTVSQSDQIDVSKSKSDLSRKPPTRVGKKKKRKQSASSNVKCETQSPVSDVSTAPTCEDSTLQMETLTKGEDKTTSTSDLNAVDQQPTESCDSAIQTTCFDTDEACVQTMCRELDDKSTQLTNIVLSCENFSQTMELDELSDQSNSLGNRDNGTDYEVVQSRLHSASPHSSGSSSLGVQTEIILSNTVSIGCQCILDKTIKPDIIITDPISVQSNSMHPDSKYDLANISNFTKELNDLIEQIDDDMEIYKLVSDQLINKSIDDKTNEDDVSLIINDANDNSDTITTTANATTTTTIVLVDKIAQFQCGLRSLLDSVEQLCMPKVVDTFRESALVPSKTRLSGDASDLVEAELIDDWQEDDFPELNFHNSTESEEFRRKFTNKENISDEDDTKLLQLQTRIDELQVLLSDRNSSSEELLDQLKQQTTLINQFKHALELVVSHLNNLPTPVDLDLINSWPPSEPEQQIAALIASEVSAREKLSELTLNQAQLQQTCEQLESERQSLETKLTVYEQSTSILASEGPDETIKESEQPDPDLLQQSSEQSPESVDPVQLAYQLCVTIQPDITETEWDVDNWEYELFNILKDRFNSDIQLNNDNDDNGNSQQVVQLTAEITALRDALDQHNAFRTQAECDLKHLLSTVQDQHELLEKLNNEKQYLEKCLEQQQLELNESATLTNQQETSAEYREFYTQLLLRLQAIISQFVADSNPDAVDDDDSGGGSGMVEQNDDEFDSNKIFEMLDSLVKKFLALKAHLEQYQSGYDSVWVSLKQKHEESQTYHEKLKSALLELNELNKLYEEKDVLVKNLQEQIVSMSAQQNVEATNLADDATTTNDNDDSSMNSVMQTNSLLLGEMNSLANPTSNELKLIAELNRLKAHLIEVEESYTNEALLAENREVTLRSKLTETESQLSNLQELCTTAEVRVRTVQNERDSTQDSLQIAHEEITHLKQSLNNLQIVLDNFQLNQNSTIQAETERLRMELNRINAKQTESCLEIDRLTNALRKTAQLNDEITRSAAENQQLNEQIKHIELKAKQRENEMDKLKTRLAKMALDTDSRIDKTLVKNLLISYFQLPEHLRANGLRVIGSLLQFNDEDYSKVGTYSGALPKLMSWVRSAVANIPSGPPKDIPLSTAHPDKSFSELLLAFLEQESSNFSSIKLPVEYYTPESAQSSHLNRKRTMSRNEQDSSTNTTDKSANPSHADSECLPHENPKFY